MSDKPRASAHRYQLALGILLVFTHLYFGNEFRAYPNPNVQSRVYLTLSIVDQHTFQIDDAVRRYGPTQDMAESGGHLFSDKAPGYSVLLVPLAWFLRMAGVPIDEYRSMAVLLRVFGLTIPAIAFWLFCWRYWSGQWHEDRLSAAVTLAGAIGTNFFIYSTQLFAHAFAGMLLFIAYVIGNHEPRRWHAVGCGLLLALAFTVDYITGPAVVILAGAFLWRRRLRNPLSTGLVFFGCAGAVAVAWVVYNTVCFGRPLDVGFHHHVDPVFGPAYRSGLWGIQWPDPAAILGMTVLPARGLLWMSPFLLLAPLGWWLMSHDMARKSQAWLCLLVSLGVAVFAMTTVQWRGGWSVSVRYLVPVIPFLLEGVRAAISRPRWAPGAFSVLAIVAVFQTALAAATFPGFPNVFDDPYYDLAIPLLRSGHVNGTLWNSAATLGGVLPYFVLLVVATGIISWWAADVRPTLWQRFAPLGIAGALIVGHVFLTAGPSYAKQLTLADVLDRMGYTCDADALRIQTHETGIHEQSSFDPVQLALIRATSPCDDVRSGARAMEWAQKAVLATNGADPKAWDALGAALAETGQFDEAIDAAEFALSQSNEPESAGRILRRLEFYKRGLPYRAVMRPR